MIIIILRYFRYYCWFMKKILSLSLILCLVWLIFFGVWELVMAADPSNVWINLSTECTMWMWKWCFSLGTTLGIAGDQPKNVTVESIAQDTILAATYMVWTILTIVIIYCGLMYIFASRDGKDVSTYKKWLISAAIWALLVRWAYAIIRLIQYIAKW